jgi:hypothetical protein
MNNTENTPKTTPPAPSYIVCPDCHSDRFLLSRRISTSEMSNGFKQRSWLAGENSSDEIVCAGCGQRLRWNATGQVYEKFPA